METLWAIKSARFPLSSLLSLLLCALDTANFLNNVQLGAPLTSVFFHMDLMALLISLETMDPPLEDKNTNLSKPLSEAANFKRTSWRENSSGGTMGAHCLVLLHKKDEFVTFLCHSAVFPDCRVRESPCPVSVFNRYLN